MRASPLTLLHTLSQLLLSRPSVPLFRRRSPSPFPPSFVSKSCALRFDGIWFHPRPEGHCKQLAPEYEKLGEQFTKEKDGIMIAKVGYGLMPAGMARAWPAAAGGGGWRAGTRYAPSSAKPAALATWGLSQTKYARNSNSEIGACVFCP